MSSIGWGARTIAGHLNTVNGDGGEEMAMQMLKLAEESGEVAAAWIGYTGQNPHKGYTHTLGDVYNELADVATAAMVAIARLGADPDAVIASKMQVMLERYGLVRE